MKRANILATLMGIGSTGLLGIVAMTIAPVAQAGDATNCLILRDTQYGGTELYNRCDLEVEATWCHYDDNGCVRFNNSWTIAAGDGYPIAKGRVLYSGCAGANSIARKQGTSVYCE